MQEPEDRAGLCMPSFTQRWVEPLKISVLRSIYIYIALNLLWVKISFFRVFVVGRGGGLLMCWMPLLLDCFVPTRAIFDGQCLSHVYKRVSQMVHLPCLPQLLRFLTIFFFYVSPRTAMAFSPQS